MQSERELELRFEFESDTILAQRSSARLALRCRSLRVAVEKGFCAAWSVLYSCVRLCLLWFGLLLLLAAIVSCCFYLRHTLASLRALDALAAP